MVFPVDVPQTTDEPMASVLRILQLQGTPLSEYEHANFTGDSLPQARRRVYGGQVLAQSLLAAAATTPSSRLPHSMHGYFVRSASFDEPITFEVDQMRDGRSFSSRHVDASQGEKTVLSSIFSFQEDQPSLSHDTPAPPEILATDPQELRSALQLFQALDHPLAKFLGKTAAFDVRHVSESIYVGPPSVQEPVQALWMKPRHAIPAEASQLIHRALLTYVIDEIMMEPVLRAHGLYWMYQGLSLATLDHAMWYLRDVNINDWLLYVQTTPSAVGSRGLADCKVYTREGVQVASAMQECMIRVPLTEEEKQAAQSREAGTL
ncbi:MAG: thioesterase family protein [Actinomycetaceae bacterium]|nr:thioesterase family protein [Actinomycetaceae bacterium]